MPKTGKNNKKILQLDLNKKPVTIYESCSSAGRALGKSHSGIAYAARNNTIAYNYYWKYIEDLCPHNNVTVLYGVAASYTESGLTEGKICDDCGYVIKKQTVIPALGQTYVKDGNYIYFGEYPQTIKSDDVTIISSWGDRGYFLGSDGCRYAAVTVSYSDGQGDGYKFSSGATIENKNTYYFKVEPIRWRILSESNGTAMIMCDIIIDVGIYGTNRTKNNYALSEVRQWLNDTFYQTAFTSLERELILATNVDNSAKSTGYAKNPYVSFNHCLTSLKA